MNTCPDSQEFVIQKNKCLKKCAHDSIRNDITLRCRKQKQAGASIDDLLENIREIGKQIKDLEIKTQLDESQLEKRIKFEVSDEIQHVLANMVNTKKELELKFATNTKNLETKLGTLFEATRKENELKNLMDAIQLNEKAMKEMANNVKHLETRLSEGTRAKETEKKNLMDAIKLNEKVMKELEEKSVKHLQTLESQLYAKIKLSSQFSSQFDESDKLKKTVGELLTNKAVNESKIKKLEIQLSTSVKENTMKHFSVAKSINSIEKQIIECIKN